MGIFEEGSGKLERDTLYRAWRIIVIYVTAFNLGWALRDVATGAWLAIFVVSLVLWAEATFKPKPPKPPATGPTLCDCGGGREGPHSKNCRLILAWAPYSTPPKKS